jgi:hypothetical protein
MALALNFLGQGRPWPEGHSFTLSSCGHSFLRSADAYDGYRDNDEAVGPSPRVEAPRFRAGDA